MALLALGIGSVVFMILDIQHNLAYAGVRIAAIGISIEAVRDARARQQRRAKEARGPLLTRRESIVVAAVLVIAVIAGLALLGYAVD